MTSSWFQAVQDKLGPRGISSTPEAMEQYLTDQRKLRTGKALAVLKPSNTAEVAWIATYAAEHGIGLVPQGGNTGYCGGATPESSTQQAIVSMERMNKVRYVDPAGFSLAVDAGLTLQEAQNAALKSGLMLPLSLGSQGSCQIGGNIGTNAGGLSVLRYGMMRDLVLGLEVVLPDGRILSDMKALRKNNAGYDVKQLFIGSEGTLGIVTGAVLKLCPEPQAHATAWIKLSQNAPLATMLQLVRRETSDLISSFEFMNTRSVELVEQTGTQPLTPGMGGALLVEMSSSSSRLPLQELLIGVLEDLIGEGWADDALLAQNEQQRQAMWMLRESIPEWEVRAGGSVKHDISVPLSQLDEFLNRAREAVDAFDPQLEVSAYGHVGDGNVHFNVLVPPQHDRLYFSSRTSLALSSRLYEISVQLGGSFSAEYGIGRFKREEFERFSDPVKINVIRKIKSAIDPLQSMNKGCLV